jgi:hypothetical protein
MLRAWTLLHCAVSITWVRFSLSPGLRVRDILCGHIQVATWRLVGPAAAGQQFPVPKKRKDSPPSPPDCLWVWVSELEIEVEIVQNRKFLSVPYPSSPSRAVLSAFLSSRLKVFFFMLILLCKLQVMANSCAGQQRSHCCCMLPFCEIGQIWTVRNLKKKNEWEME